MLVLLVALTIYNTTKADEAMRSVETSSATAKGKQEKSLEIIEKAILAQPPRCAQCPVCLKPSGGLTGGQPAQPANADPMAAKMPTWAWIIVSSLVGAATGALITGTVFSAVGARK